MLFSNHELEHEAERIHRITGREMPIALSPEFATTNAESHSNIAVQPRHERYSAAPHVGVSSSAHSVRATVYALQKKQSVKRVREAAVPLLGRPPFLPLYPLHIGFAGIEQVSIL